MCPLLSYTIHILYQILKTCIISKFWMTGFQSNLKNYHLNHELQNAYHFTAQSSNWTNKTLMSAQLRRKEREFASTHVWPLGCTVISQLWPSGWCPHTGPHPSRPLHCTAPCNTAGCCWGRGERPLSKAEARDQDARCWEDVPGAHSNEQAGGTPQYSSNADKSGCFWTRRSPQRPHGVLFFKHVIGPHCAPTESPSLGAESVLCWVTQSHRLFATPWTVAHEGPLSMGFSRQENWSGLPCPPLQGIFPTQVSCSVSGFLSNQAIKEAHRGWI